MSTDYDDAGRIKKVYAGVANGSGGTYASSVTYAAPGGLASAAVGPFTETRTYDALLRLSSIGVTGATPWSWAGTYWSGGNLKTQTVNDGVQTRVQSFNYDKVNRLSVASEDASWTQNYLYDAYGNRAVNSVYVPYPVVTPQASDAAGLSAQYAGNQWKPGGVSYDGSGNQTANGLGSYAFDAENRMATATIPGLGTESYTYDGEGRRVKRSGPLGTTIYAYDLGGKVAAEYQTPAGTVVMTAYRFEDHLGTTRMVSDGTATGYLKRFDYLPFGEEIAAGVNGRGAKYSSLSYPTVSQDGVPLKFTGKERDSETGLDYFGARYYSGAQGRFTSTDPLNAPNLQRLHPEQFTRFIGNPQNWNGYAYAHNNPLAKIDPDGYLTIVVPGTWNDQEQWRQSKFVQSVSKTFGEQAVVLNNPNMANTPQGRAAAANAIKALVANHKFGEGEKLNIVAHSHGGNAVFAATQSGLAHKIDNLVTLGTPVRSDYAPNTSLIGNHINAFSNFDSVQTHGGFSESMGTWGVSHSEVGLAGRTVGTATNVEAGLSDLGGLGVRNHSALWQNTDVWVKQVEPLLKK
ncbi:MAG: RHS repeat-associated core domain-containing protein [Bryobacteraceae bacterium]